MANPTQEEVVEAARGLEADFTRDQLEQKLGADRQEMKPAWRAAKQAGQIEKVRDDADGTRYFRVSP